jgi:hypothetical protein
MGGGVPAIVCGLYERSARIAIEREEGTKTFEVPLWDLLPGVAIAILILLAPSAASRPSRCV